MFITESDMTRDVKIKVGWYSSELRWKRKNFWISAENDWISLRAQPGYKAQYFKISVFSTPAENLLLKVRERSITYQFFQTKKIAKNVPLHTQKSVLRTPAEIFSSIWIRFSPQMFAGHVEVSFEDSKQNFSIEVRKIIYIYIFYGKRWTKK